MSLVECAHCSDGEGTPRSSYDHGRAVNCPACGEKICPSCRAMSGPTTCGNYADGNENAHDILQAESASGRRQRVAAWKRADSSEIRGTNYPLQGFRASGRRRKVGK